MGILVGVVLVVFCVGVVLYPFLRGGRRTHVTGTLDPLEEARAWRSGVYEEMRTLRLEYDLGTIGEEEYQERLHAYRLRAAMAMREQERLESELGDLDQALEAEITAVRQSLGARGEREP